MKYTMTTLGCKVNQYETQAMDTILRAHGHTPVKSGEADAVIINTCAVTAESGRKSRQAVRRLKGENPNAVVAVCGCFSQVSPEEAASLGADVLFGSGDRRGFIAAVEKAAAEHAGCVSIKDISRERTFEDLPAGALSGRTRAYLKIQDGCDNFCTYCIIPYARGRVRSLPETNAAQLAADLEKDGFRELVITGIEIASYGKDLNDGSDLTSCIEAIASATDDVRLHLGSLEPRVVTEDFCARLAGLGRVDRHFHLSLQSGCDATLKAMGRRYDTARFYESVKLLRKYFPGCGITADVIVGFPGETAADHLASVEFIKKCGFSAVHVFPYSERPGTKAAAMDGRHTRSEKAARAAEAQQAANECQARYLESCVGQILPVLFETYKDGAAIGHADNYCQVCVPGARRRGLVQNVQITCVCDKMLVGKVV